MKTSELTGAALDWAVATCLGHKKYINYGAYIRVPYSNDSSHTISFCPTTDWGLGGPIIEREGITVSRTDQKSYKGQMPWVAYLIEHLFEDEYEHEYQHGPTPLIAAMRCYVASKLGDDIDIPKELRA
jgi:hypothetical protein